MNNKIRYITTKRVLFVLLFTCINLGCWEQGRISRPTNNQQAKKTSVVKISEPDGFVDNYGYVDLGLPSGTLWATCNVGAHAPTDLGEQYAWGGNKAQN